MVEEQFVSALELMYPNEVIEVEFKRCTDATAFPVVETDQWWAMATLTLDDVRVKLEQYGDSPGATFHGLWVQIEARKAAVLAAKAAPSGPIVGWGPIGARAPGTLDRQPPPVRCRYTPGVRFMPCTRVAGHDGPCAHPPAAGSSDRCPAHCQCGMDRGCPAWRVT